VKVLGSLVRPAQEAMASIPGLAAIFVANAAASPVPPKISTLLFLVIQQLPKG
jgi:hypothetical protein